MINPRPHHRFVSLAQTAANLSTPDLLDDFLDVIDSTKHREKPVIDADTFSATWRELVARSVITAH